VDLAQADLLVEASPVVDLVVAVEVAGSKNVVKGVKITVIGYKTK
jgi:hypothetical protein